MPTVTKPPRAVFPNHESLYTNYRALQKHIFYNGDTYVFRKIIRKRDTFIHIYRCEKERHTLKIHMGMYAPFYIEGVYSVEEVD
ncbi:hypothetical protein FOH38_23535 [Lysinibacillus fusiformis]|nr:hypothetical protein FOH38_23535 [Lysinibacillus fusiformis]